MDNTFNGLYGIFGVNPYKNLSRTELNNKLLEASKAGNLSEVTALLGHGADIKATNNFGSNALILACWNGRTDTAALLLQNGADIKAETSIGDNALMLACRYGHTSTAAFLVQNGADIKATNNDGDSALMLACWGGHTDTAAILLQNGADIKATNNGGYNALMFACWSNRTTSTTAFLVQNGADIKATSNFGDNALILACRYGHTGTAAFLLQNGADMKATNNDGMNALMVACGGGHTDTAYLLLNRMTPEERAAFASQDIDNFNIVNGFEENLRKNTLTVYDKMRFELWEEVEVKKNSSIFRLLPTELRNYIRRFELQLKFKDSWYRFRAFSDMNLVAQCCALYPDKPIFPVLFLGNRKAQDEPEENHNSNKRTLEIEEKMETEENSNKIDYSI